MFGKALYYPNIDIHDPVWLRSAILFWDEIKTIAPTAIRQPYQTEETKICQEEGLLSPIEWDLSPPVIENLGRKVIALLENPPWLLPALRKTPNDPTLNAINFANEDFREAKAHQIEWSRMYPEKMSGDLQAVMKRIGISKFHPMKMTKEARALLKGVGLLIDEESFRHGRMHRLFDRQDDLFEDGFMLVESNFADAYMAALAAMLAEKTRYSPLTPHPKPLGYLSRYLLDDIAIPTRTDAQGTLISITIKGLSIDPTAPIEKLIQFRKSRSDQLDALHGKFDELTEKMGKFESIGEVQEKAQRIFRNNILPELKKLKSELKNESIPSAYRGFTQMTMLTGATGTVLANTTNLPDSILLGAGAFATLSTIGIQSFYARNKIKVSSPYSYLLDLERDFSLPNHLLE